MTLDHLSVVDAHGNGNHLNYERGNGLTAVLPNGKSCQTALANIERLVATEGNPHIALNLTLKAGQELDSKGGTLRFQTKELRTSVCGYDFQGSVRFNIAREGAH